MPDLKGVNHNMLEMSNRIGERGVEGVVHSKLERFSFNNEAYAADDTLDSEFLRIPQDAVLTDISIYKSLVTPNDGTGVRVEWVYNNDGGDEVRRRIALLAGAAGFAMVAPGATNTLRAPFFTHPTYFRNATANDPTIADDVILPRDYRIGLSLGAALTANAARNQFIYVMLKYMNL